MENKDRIRGFEDLEVYKNAYQGMILVHRSIISRLPKEENYDLKDQLRRSTKAIPRLIAEGQSKRHQSKGFLKYIDDAHSESNETLVSICQVRDLYPAYVDKSVCESLVDLYDKVSRQLYNLGVAWGKYARRNRPTHNVSPDATA